MDSNPPIRSDRIALSGRELASVLGISSQHIYRLRKEGKLPKGVRIGRRTIRWPTDEIRHWLIAGAPDEETWERSKIVQQWSNESS